MKAMSNVDVYAVCYELNEILKDARIQKAYQPSKDTVIIRFHVPGEGRKDVVLQAGLRVHTTQYPPENPKIPPSFPMLLRKHLKNGTVTEVRQHNFDRILEVDIQKEHRFTLVVELFSQGNIILLDEKNQIILPLKHRHTQGRKITSKEIYQYPEERGINPLKVQKEDLKNLFMNSDSDLIRTLARSGLGGLYSEEIFLRSKIDKKIPATEVSEQKIEVICQTIDELFKPLKSYDFKPQIVKNDKKDVLPLELKIYKNYHKKTFKNFNQAADEFYSSKVGSDIKKVQEDIWKAEVGKYEKRLRIQEESLQKFQETVTESKKKGDLLYSHYKEVQNILDIIHNARKKYSWKQIAAKLKKARKEGLKDANIIESLDKMGVLKLKLEEETVTVDTNLEIPENAENYYNRGKKAKKKIKGVNIAIEKTKKELEDVRNKREIALQKIKMPQKRVHRELKWFEKLRWFLSSDGIMVIAGRDAGTNELVVKRYLESNDLYMHSDIHGAPSVVIKKTKDDIPESTIHEAGIFAASFSSAWAKGFGSLDVYWVHPEQVSKTPQSGEFVARGAFIIRGTKNYLRGLPLKIAVGIVDFEGKRIMAGPVEALDKHTDKYVILKPGFRKKEEISREILKKIDLEHILTLEDVMRVLPSGKCDIVQNNI